MGILRCRTRVRSKSLGSGRAILPRRRAERGDECGEQAHCDSKSNMAQSFYREISLLYGEYMVNIWFNIWLMYG